MKLFTTVCFLSLSLSAMAQEVDFRKRDNRLRGHHKIVVTSSQCESGQSCKGFDRKGIVRMEIAARKSGIGYALYVYNDQGKIVTVFEDDSQLIAFEGQLGEIKQDPKCKIELILDEDNLIDSSVVKCPN